MSNPPGLSTPTPVPLLDVRGLRTEFRTEEGLVRAVNGVSFTVHQGEVLGIVGESGGGKSVTGLSIMRLISWPPGRIVGGEVWFGGRDLLQLQASQIQRVRGNEIAMIFQDPMTSLNPVMRIGTQIGEALALHKGMSPSAARRRTLDLLRTVEIPDAENRIDDYPHQFSGGMRQRVMIAMALSCEPKLLIADEPTTALDVTVQAQILRLLKRLGSDLGMAIILITHDLGVVAGIANRIVVMYGGHMVEVSPVDQEFFRNPRHPYSVGLLGALPRLDSSKQSSRLTPIRGQPPNLIDPPPGCPFALRCPYRRSRCDRERPILRPVRANHEVACHFDPPDGTWLSADSSDRLALPPVASRGEEHRE